MRHEGWVNNHHAFANLLKKFYCLLYTQTQKETRNIFYYTFLLFLFPFFSSFLLLLLFCFHFHINNTFMAKKFDFYDFEESLFSLHTISCFHNKKKSSFCELFLWYWTKKFMWNCSTLMWYFYNSKNLWWCWKFLLTKFVKKFIIKLIRFSS